MAITIGRRNQAQYYHAKNEKAKQEKIMPPMRFRQKNTIILFQAANISKDNEINPDADTLPCLEIHKIENPHPLKARKQFPL